MKEAKLSKLQFKNPKIKRVLYEQNSGYIPEEVKQMPINYTVNTVATGECSVNMELVLRIGEHGKTYPFVIEMEVESEFAWSNSYDENTKQKLLSLNCPSLLLSYARPFITHMTVDAGFPPFVLPFIDFKANESGL